MRRGLATVALVILLGACASGGEVVVVATPSTTPTTLSPADATLVACDELRTMWREHARISSDPHGFGDDTPDPHGVAAQAAADAAFAAARSGTAEAQRLAELAAQQYEGTASGDLFATVTDFFALCGQQPPHVPCVDGTICAANRLDSYGSG
ncbi:MAG: hypothetical protein ABL966_07130 [Acidimicrobiales bacterium]